MSRKNSGWFSLAIVIIAAFIWGWLPSSHAKNLPAPNIKVTTITGKKIELAKLQGKPVMITFWATDCASCMKEIPILKDLYQEFHPQGLEIIAITMYYDIPSHVVQMAKAAKIPYDIALDLRGHNARMLGQVKLIPTTFLISPEGDIVEQITGLFDKDDMAKQITQLL